MSPHVIFDHMFNVLRQPQKNQLDLSDEECLYPGLPTTQSLFTWECNRVFKCTTCGLPMREDRHLTFDTVCLTVESDGGSLANFVENFLGRSRRSGKDYANGHPCNKRNCLGRCMPKFETISFPVILLLDSATARDVS